VASFPTLASLTSSSASITWPSTSEALSVTRFGARFHSYSIARIRASPGLRHVSRPTSVSGVCVQRTHTQRDVAERSTGAGAAQGAGQIDAFTATHRTSPKLQSGLAQLFSGNSYEFRQHASQLRRRLKSQHPWPFPRSWCPHRHSSRHQRSITCFRARTPPPWRCTITSG
jgi:hypothetical protein